ncbi:uncharacterized protein ASPGLDRAFT_1501325 [Aspergillus glaucus CBS 516.65]|uniref:F-box domain-containing protein n=1 Tax=Aspergillus glaucus CBS 516.65 TaxID=1160497 RepID=A0A1L9VAY1_ASPGL|nr:hypothetical protein ASPGLDRAFT_1501325 [Aspergillus glaucus CBS 516.65]OJJ81035.1 hypothetical protein ASPGLDRAFT_1501325 [Aspergillus glaucus CBS 516.65]
MVSFFDLPRSIREEIYRHALVKARVFVRPFISMEYMLHPDRAEIYDNPNLALLCVSRRIYHEATPIYLGENIFSIVQVDMLAAARMENRRVAKNLRQIRRLELIFDHRDYNYMAEFLGTEIPTVMTEIEDWADESPVKKVAMRDLSKIRDHFDVRLIDTTGRRQRQALNHHLHQYKNDSKETPHDRLTENLKEYLWGRTLTFVRQNFRLTHLFIDLRHCSCPVGCCRLADQVLDWGWMYVWIHGLPDEVQVRGSSRSEKEVIARSLDRQSFHPKLKIEEVYDQSRAQDYRGLMQYNALLRSVYRRLNEV